MLEIGPQHTLNYRHDILSPLFDYIQSTESCFLIGAGSMGKTRLLDHLMRQDVQQNYLGEQANKTLLIRMDMNRISELSEWGIYELGLTSLLQTGGLQPELEKFAKDSINDLLKPLLDRPDTLKALRYLELTIGGICRQNNFKLCFVFDEFDEAYRQLPAKVFAHLRAIRDANKNQLSYTVFLRNLPHCLRPPADHESFYELLSRNLIGIGPYNLTDANEMLRQLEARRSLFIQLPNTRENLFRVSGGHPGLLQALFGLLKETPEGDPPSGKYKLADRTRTCQRRMPKTF